MPLRTNSIRLNYTLKMESAFHFGTGLRKGLVHRSVAEDKDGYLYIPGSTLKGSLRNQLYDLQLILFPPQNQSQDHRKDPHRGADDLTEFKPDRDYIDFTRFLFGTRFSPCTLFFDDAHLMESDKDYFDGPNPDDKEYVAKQATMRTTESDEASDKDPPNHNKEYRGRQTATRTQVHISRLTRTAESGMLFTSEFGIRELNFDGRIYGRLSGVPLDGSNYTYSVVMLLAALKALSRLGG